MVDEIILELQTRDVVGKGVKKLRQAGKVPAVIHDHGRPSVHVSGSYTDMVKTYRTAGKHKTVELRAGDKTFTALIKGVDIDPKKNQLRHVVFNAVNKNQKVEAEIPVEARFNEGNESTPAERAGLIVLANLETIEVKAIPSKIPDVVTYDGEKLVNVGDHATVADLLIPDGVEVLTEPEHAVATVYEPSAIAAANDEAAGQAEAEVPAEGATDSAEGDTTAGADNSKSDNKEKPEK